MCQFFETENERGRRRRKEEERKGEEI
jgi:hypothetical protein